MLADATPQVLFLAPPSMRDFMAFEEHLAPIVAARGGTMAPEWYQIPAFYFASPAAIQGPVDPVIAAPEAVELDFELEIAAIVGLPGRDISPGDAEAHIAGFCLLGDWSARDLQRRERPIGLGPVKGKDWGTSLGPWFVSADEVFARRSAQGYDVAVTAFVNDVQYSDGNLSEAYWSFPDMIAYASRGADLRTGDIIGSGTVRSGCIAELASRHGSERYPWLVAGDRVRLSGGELLGDIDIELQPPRPFPPLSRDLSSVSKGVNES